MPTEQFYTTAPAAREANISESTLRLWEKTGLVQAQLTTSGVRLFHLPEVLKVARTRQRHKKNTTRGESHKTLQMT